MASANPIIRCFPNPKHVKRVLAARKALRIIPPSEGSWKADERAMIEDAA